MNAIRPAGRGLTTSLAIISLIAGLLVLVTPASAEAGASGCTSAPGYTGAANCIKIYGESLTVTKSKSTYLPGVSPFPSTTCNWSSKWRFKRSGESNYKTRTVTKYGCTWIPLIDVYHWWYNVGVMKDKSSFCAKTKNSRTNYAWTSEACKTIKL